MPEKSRKRPISCRTPILPLLFAAALHLACVQVQVLPAALPNVEHAVVIGVDGFGGAWVEANAGPNLKRLLRQGAYTLHARGVMPTSSSPNWASMIMGAGPEQHGVTSNDWETNRFDFAPTVSGQGGMFPTIFGLLRDQRPKSVITCIHDWDGFGRLFERQAADLIESVKGSTNTARRAAEVIRTRKPTLTFIHFDDLDHAGHSKGWGSPEYLAEIAIIDALIGTVLDAIEAAHLSGKTLVLVTADHGGDKNGKHGGNSMNELEIPWILAGPGVRRGHVLKTHINTFDTAPTLAYAFGLNLPAGWIGKPVTEAFAETRR